MDSKELTREIIGAAIEVHRVLGPGLLESAYVECLCHELALREVPFRREVPLPLTYKGCKLDCGYRLDLLVAETVVIEAKSIDALLPIHDAQLLSYLRLGGWSIGLLINFNVPLLKDGVHRRVLQFEDSSASSASLR
jgi:GxxExxY protein